MGAFNEVSVATKCPTCSQPVQVRVQFKYGDTWQHQYRLGEALKWGGNDVGEPGHRRVVVDGAAERCPKCGHEDDWNFYVLLERDVIASVEPATGVHAFPTDQPFIVLED
jgi:hypothetical protein